MNRVRTAGVRTTGERAAGVATVSGGSHGPAAAINKTILLEEHGDASSCDCEGRACEQACPSRLSCRHCEQKLHELSNALTLVLMNAQLVGWKLPPYSHLKRSVREIERGAQRSGELVKGLLRQFPDHLPSMPAASAAEASIRSPD